MGQARSSLESLAVLPVINSFVFVFRTFGLSFQEVAIARLDENRGEPRAALRRFAVVAGHRGVRRPVADRLHAGVPLSGSRACRA